MSRLLGTADRSQLILELGAGYCPVAPKSKGWRTHVVDHASQSELRAKYANAADVDVNLIENVDTIWRGGSLHEAVPAELVGQFDFIIASHVLEHLPDLVDFLQSASRLVKLGGAMSIALPDRRYCFDCFRPWTTTGCLLDAHHRRMNRHGLKTGFDHIAYAATVGGKLAWGPYPIPTPQFIDPFAVAEATVAQFFGQPDGQYRDYHAWQFTPSGFRLAMLELAALDLTDWQVVGFHGTEHFEFFVTLQRVGALQSDPAGLQDQRRTLLLKQLEEMREQINFVIGAAEGSPESAPATELALISRLTEQDRLLQEMSETLRWVRAIISPIRRVWRVVRFRS
jgi:SAM-dependent methyltransferase